MPLATYKEQLVKGRERHIHSDVKAYLTVTLFSAGASLITLACMSCVGGAMLVLRRSWEAAPGAASACTLKVRVQEQAASRLAFRACTWGRLVPQQRLYRPACESGNPELVLHPTQMQKYSILPVLSDPGGESFQYLLTQARCTAACVSRTPQGNTT